MKNELLDNLNEKLQAVRGDMTLNCQRIEQMLQRFNPQPQGVSGGKPEVAQNGIMSRLENTIDELGTTAKWLNDLANRLERIA